MSNVWQKQNWIKDILSKSGTEITEIKDDVESGAGGKDLRKMVYYTALPLMMQPQSDPTSSLGHNKHPDPSMRLSTNPAGLVGSVHSSAYSTPMSATPDRHHPMMYDLHNRPAISDNHPLDQLSTTTVSMVQPRPSPAKRQRGQLTVKAPKPQFKCEQCNMMFGSKSAHTSHMKSHAKMALKAQQSSTMQMHPTTGGEPSTSPASNCSTTSSVLSADPYQCDVCHKTFAVPARLVRHYRTHTGERPFECEFCHKMFSVKENLQVHRRIHTKERPYKCEVCGRAFEHSGKLHRHMRIHTGERPHKCSVCGKTFIQSGQLVIHMRTHTGEKPYKCPVEGCGKGFTCSKQLKVHSRTHTGEKPYHCDICFRDFGYNHVLKLHRVQHYGSKCYKCTICDETFKNKKEMEAHIKGHANEQPDEEGGADGPSLSSYTTIIEEPVLPIRRVSETDTSSTTSSISVSMSSQTAKLPETPRETSSSDAMSDTEDGAGAYYQMYPRFESSNYVSNGGVNPALLAAVSAAAEQEAAQAAAEITNRMSSPHRRSESPLNMGHGQVHHLQTPSPSAVESNNHQYPNHATYASFQPLALMRQQGFYSPVPQVEEFRSSISASSDIVKRVEAALAGAGESMLTPPRSSPESPDRSSSPESDSVLMANRANMSLPLRKRKLYHLPDDEPTAQQQEQQQQQAAAAMLHLKSSSSAAEDVQMRLSSVIQFAKAT